MTDRKTKVQTDPRIDGKLKRVMRVKMIYGEEGYIKNTQTLELQINEFLALLPEDAHPQITMIGYDRLIAMISFMDEEIHRA